MASILEYRKNLITRDLAWLGGFFDAEGTVGVYHSTRRGHDGYKMVAGLTTTEHSITSHCKSRWGGYVHPRRKKNVTCYYWQVSCRKAEEFLRAIEPYARVKKDQIALALRFQDGQRMGPKSAEARRAQPTQVATMARLKHTPPGVEGGIDPVWLAGFFDGDGCISISLDKSPRSRHGKSHCLVVTITQRWMTVLQWLQLTLGGSLVNLAHQRTPMGSRRCPILFLRRRQAVAFLRPVLPYLQVKRAQAILALEFQRGIGKRSKVSDGEYDRRVRIAKQMSLLNRQRDVV